MLLDAQGVAKVADFGTVRDFDVDKGVATHTLTRAIVGTTGYMPRKFAHPCFCDLSVISSAVCLTLRYRLFGLPAEYTTQGIVSEKLDVYALAVVLVELLTGKTGMEVAALHCDGPELFEDMQQYLDARGGAWPGAAVVDLAALAEQCISYHARARPAAGEIVLRLTVLV